MPPELDEAWEYYAPDPEVAELLEEAANPNGLDGFATVLNMQYDGEKRDPLSRVRLGRGNPDGQTTWVPGEKDKPVPRDRYRERVLHVCKNPRCGKEFEALVCKRRKYCSVPCADLCSRKTAKRKLPDRDCLMCGKTFRPRAWYNRYCSQSCRSRVVAATRRVYPTKGAHVRKQFAALWAAGTTTLGICALLGIGRGTAKRWRVEMGLASRRKVCK